MNILEIKDFKVSIEDKEIVKGIDLNLEKGKVTVIMGPNGSGKSTLANGLMGHPDVESSGSVLLEGEDVLEMEADERSKEGIFLSFQYPVVIPGLTVSNFLRTAINARRDKKDPIKVGEFVKLLNEKMKLLNIPKEFAGRYLNEGFSGGEKKKMEILQLAMLNPKVAILDETDSGLDIDSLRQVCESINLLREQNPDLTVLVITHYQRMLNHLRPDTVCIMLDGRIVKKGGAELAHKLESEGYEAFK
ncbi:MAG: Fe-S cluster assembly ATPase SufC [Candidatus Woesearchaeota archaeon]